MAKRSKATRKYDPRDVPMKGRSFTFGNQLHDNMF